MYAPTSVIIFNSIVYFVLFSIVTVVVASHFY